METADPVDARGAVETSGPGTIVDVYRTILSRPTVYANAIVRSLRVRTRGPVVTYTRPHRALVYVRLARIAGPLGRARARVTVHAVHACSTVETRVRYAVVNILLAILSPETCENRKA